MNASFAPPAVGVNDHHHAHLPPALTFDRWLCGGLGGVARVLIGYPFDQVKITMQMHRSQELTIGRCVKNMWATDGQMRAFYRGSGLSFAFSTVQMSLNFGVKSVTERELAKNHYFDNHTAIRAGVAGMAGGFFHALSVSPVDYIRIQQLAHNNIPLFATVKHIVKHHGYAGLFKGVTPTILRDAPGLGLYFGAYKLIMDKVNSLRGGANAPKDYKYYAGCILAGSAAGVAWWGPTYHFDMAKTLMQKDVQTPPKYPTIRSALTSVYKEKGMRGFVRGLDVCLARAVVVNAGVFLTVEASHKFLFE